MSSRLSLTLLIFVRCTLVHSFHLPSVCQLACLTVCFYHLQRGQWLQKFITVSVWLQLKDPGVLSLSLRLWLFLQRQIRHFAEKLGASVQNDPELHCRVAKIWQHQKFKCSCCYNTVMQKSMHFWTKMDECKLFFSLIFPFLWFLFFTLV